MSRSTILSLSVGAVLSVVACGLANGADAVNGPTRVPTGKFEPTVPGLKPVDSRVPTGKFEPTGPSVKPVDPATKVLVRLTYQQSVSRIRTFTNLKAAQAFRQTLNNWGITNTLTTNLKGPIHEIRYSCPTMKWFDYFGPTARTRSSEDLQFLVGIGMNVKVPINLTK